MLFWIVLAFYGWLVAKKNAMKSSPKCIKPNLEAVKLSILGDDLLEVSLTSFPHATRRRFIAF
jgi:hypothetical protein